MRRYILALLILLGPFLIELVVAAIIPSQSNLINSIRGTVSSAGQYELTMNNYSTQTIPYYLKGNVDTTPVQTLLNNYYTSTNRPKSTLLKLDDDLVNDKVLEWRKSSYSNFLNNYYVGMSLNLTSSNTLSASIYHSSLAYHSSANILNEIDNMILTLMTNDNTKSISTLNVPIASNSSLSGSTTFLDVLACLDSLPVSFLSLLNGFIVAFMASTMIMHLARERCNGSKQLQYLSGIHYVTYWVSNYCFDLIIFVFNISSMVFILKIVNLIKNDSSSEIYPIAVDETLGYFYLLLLISSFSWCTWSYLWSFLFKSDIIAFVVSIIFLAFMAFLDVIWLFIQLLVLNGSKTATTGSNIMSAIRYIFAILFPSVTVKRAIYNLKIRSNTYCVEAANTYLIGK